MHDFDDELDNDEMIEDTIPLYTDSDSDEVWDNELDNWDDEYNYEKEYDPNFVVDDFDEENDDYDDVLD